MYVNVRILRHLIEVLSWAIDKRLRLTINQLVLENNLNGVSQDFKTIEGAVLQLTIKCSC